MTKEQLLDQAKPILFNTEMVMAILDDQKSCTRQIVKGLIPKDAVWGYSALTPSGYISCRGTFEEGYGEKFFKLPYHPGSILYVRETWCKSPFTNHYVYRADGDGELFKQSCDSEIMDDTVWKWHPSIHMPKAAARIFLKVTDIRVERLQDMNLDDFLSEGVEPRPEAFNDPENAYQQAKKIFQSIWNSTIKKAEQNSYSWEANPWVWVIEFERVIPE